MIDLAKIKEVVGMMSTNDLSEVSIKQGDEHITIKRGQQAGTIVNHQPVIYNGAPANAGHAPAHTAVTHAGSAAPIPLAPSNAPAPAPAPVAPPAPKGPTIDSPMVGTFYGRPNPDAKAFVTVGQTVSKDAVVCIIEAMKVFNEIKAEKDGVIDAILVKDGQAVEFGQKLFALQ
ncbi:acetyl-CoA carboxylase biotin carboxyl carrier protein subunit [Phycisphaerae bacterium]|nr:acetyl-CoA carboxylase biotin carboxyl carrier protein subunit [Phycisphaerae bacterium]